MNQPPIKTQMLSTNPYIKINNQGKIVEFDLKLTQHILGRDETQADLVVSDNWGIVSRCQALFKKVNNDYYIYDGNGKNPSSNGLFINKTRITPQHGYLLSHETEITIGQNPKNWIIISYYNPQNIPSLPRKLPEKTSINLKDKAVTLGRNPDADLCLDAPTVSYKHAVIDRDISNANKYIIYDYSTNGIFVNGEKVNQYTYLENGTIIKIGPYILVAQGDKLLVADRGNNIRLDCANILKKIKTKNKQNKIILNNISLAIEPGEFVGIVGGSGAGKSTLMRALLGIESINQGKVYLNGEDLQHNFNMYRNQIGYVPQSDIIHKDLTVREVLYYSAKLRLPNDTDLEKIIAKTLQDIEMLSSVNTLVSQLSGGQIKRVSIGVELLADPKLFFLDEPTSGLDPGLDKKMMQLLRKLADQGRTIILVTHATSNINLCDRLIFLGKGGNLCYLGKPEETLNFFQVKQGNFADIYLHLETIDKVLEEAAKFEQSTDYQNNIENRLITNNSISYTNKNPKQVQGFVFKQLIVLAERYGKLLIRDKLFLALSLLTAPIGISLIKFAIDKQPFILGTEDDPALAPLALKVLFVFTSASIWVGLSSSLQEIVKENIIYLRERLVNLNLISYLISKISILGALGLAQSFLIAVSILVLFESPESELIPWFLGIFITNFLTLFSSVSLGLMISASVKNNSQANSALPLLLIPQIIFAGVLFTMEGLGKVISWLTISRWSIGAYGILVNINKLVPEPMVFVDGTTINPPFEGSPVYESNGVNLLLNLAMLFLQSIIYLIVTYWLQKKKDII